MKDFLPPPDEMVQLPREAAGVFLLTYLVTQDPHMLHLGNLLGSPDLETYAGPGWMPKVRGRVSEAWAWLESEGFLAPVPTPGPDNGWRYVTDRGWDLQSGKVDPATFVAGKFLPMGSLHPRLEEKVRPLYVQGDYETAVFAAMKCVEVAVRDAAGLGAADYGVDLMRKAFNKDAGPLAMQFEVVAEREAVSHLFAGALGLLKNPSSHREVNIVDPLEAADIIRLADLMLRIVDRSGEPEESDSPHAPE